MMAFVILGVCFAGAFTAAYLVRREIQDSLAFTGERLCCREVQDFRERR